MGAAVAARSEPPTAGALWPFPDLALLRLGEDVQHPCALLDAREPSSDGDCYAWGFARREAGLDPTGSPASFRYEGLEGDDYLRLKQGQSAPGLSGAPLLCPRRRAVVGVISASRDVRSDLGGWAAPLSALLIGGPGVPRDLAELGGTLRHANRQAVVARRESWHQVLPVEDVDDLVDQPWERFTRQAGSSPSSLLLAEHAVVPYLFREQEVEDAVTWCASPAAMSITTVAGRGGAGKTRFAVELCRLMAARGWVAGMWRPDRQPPAVAVPRLIVIDYVEAAEPRALRDALDELRRRATDIAPVRVLLLTRTRSGGAKDPVDALREDASATLQRVVDASESNDAAAATLTALQRQTLYERALADFIGAWHGDAGVGIERSDDIPDLAGDRFALPLEVLFAAFDHAMSDDESLAVRPAVERVLLHEQRYWDRTAGRLDPLDTAELGQCVALATLAGAATAEQAHALLSILPTLKDDMDTRTAAIAWLSELYDGESLLNPLRPDRLGEALVARLLRQSGESGLAVLNAIAGLPADDQLVQAMDVLTRLSATDAEAAHATAQMLAAHHVELVTRAERQARGAPGQPGRYDLANAILRPLAHQLGERVREALAGDEPDNTTYQRDLAVSYERLGDLARQSGQASEAERLYRQSLAVREALAGDEPDNTTYQRDLTISYNKLGDLARQSGQAGETEEQFAPAVRIRRALSQQEPGRVDLAEELAVALYLLAQAAPITTTDLKREITARLSPFERTDALTTKGVAVLSWART